jgi:UDP-N-acetylmuramoyl-tripeptide--D-alanyl-D-alanine ligase
MFRLKEITKAVGGQLLSGDPQLGINGVSIDSRTIKGGELFISIKGSRFDGHNFIQEAIRKGAKAIIAQGKRQKAKGKRKVAYIKVADTRRALADLARFHRQRFDIPIIAVTGSNGKTTLKDMIAWILSSRMKVLKNPGTQNNEIGVPLALLKLDISHDVVVLELGTNHFGEIAYLAGIVQPNFGIITNIGPAHLENLENLSGVYKEKVSLLKNLLSPKIAVLNDDDRWLKRLRNEKGAFVVTYGIKDKPRPSSTAMFYSKEGRGKCDFPAGEIRLTSKKTVEFAITKNSASCSRIQLNTAGYANVYNALAAIAVARILGWDYEVISRRLKTFGFSPGRLKFTKLNGISFIDDTYNANPASLFEALGALGRFRVRGRRILVMGDMLELGSSKELFHRQAGIQVARICDAFISVGGLSRLTAHWAVKGGLSKDCVFSCQTPPEAVSLLFRTIKPSCRDLILVKGSRLMKMEEVFKK